MDDEDFMDESEQGRASTVIDVAPAPVWEVLTDSSVLSAWVPAVKAVLEHAETEHPGSTRRCTVTLGGRDGYMVERCVEAVPERRLRYAVEEDSFGLGRMLNDYSFTLELAPVGESRTEVTLRSFYSPRGPVARALNALVLRRRFGRVRREILAGLERYMDEGRPRAIPSPRD